MPEEAAKAGFEIGKDGVSSVVVGVDGSPPSLNAAAWAAGLARRENATLVLVYVEPVTSAAYWTPLGMASATEAAQAYLAELRETAGHYLSEHGVHWEVVHQRGDPATALESVADELKADCIVVGKSRRRGGLLGTVPKGLLAHSMRPVVVVP
ncbi:universal stress protein [Solihabitans fulvus]|uniref:universal stress protein n=1 Tax=Solihabitans fulvus TaxID=1892852 RepID=UPI001CB75DB1|nr:universal stress protein [Solihabitans fulvus]